MCRHSLERERHRGVPMWWVGEPVHRLAWLSAKCLGLA